uniref:Uncharacterized protein n=1 Tax=Glossina brevipalpis TaxID=37001 RepID=A0A1A9W614_9MUSC
MMNVLKCITKNPLHFNCSPNVRHPSERANIFILIYERMFTESSATSLLKVKWAAAAAVAAVCCNAGLDYSARLDF